MVNNITTKKQWIKTKNATFKAPVEIALNNFRIHGSKYTVYVCAGI